MYWWSAVINQRHYLWLYIDAGDGVALSGETGA
jgi:hypothetical protein